MDNVVAARLRVARVPGPTYLVKHRFQRLPQLYLSHLADI